MGSVHKIRHDQSQPRSCWQRAKQQAIDFPARWLVSMTVTKQLLSRAREAGSPATPGTGWALQAGSHGGSRSLVVTQSEPGPVHSRAQPEASTRHVFALAMGTE